MICIQNLLEVESAPQGPPQEKHVKQAQAILDPRLSLMCPSKLHRTTQRRRQKILTQICIWKRSSNTITTQEQIWEGGGGGTWGAYVKNFVTKAPLCLAHLIIIIYNSIKNLKSILTVTVFEQETLLMSDMAVALSTLVYKWTLAILILVGNPALDWHPIQKAVKIFLALC